MKRLDRAVWLLRIFAVAVILWWGYIAVTADSAFVTVIGVVIIATLIWVLILGEQRRRWSEEIRWLNAASSDDPIASLARSDYMRSLSLKDTMTVIEWMAHKHERDLADAPPVVRKYLEI